METEVKCRYCKSSNSIKWGFRKTENRGRIQKYFCRDCNKYFTEDNGFYRMRNAPEKITLCLDLFYRGVSTRQIQSHLQAFYPHNSDYSTIYRWVVKYADMISKFTDKLKIKVGKEMQIDEVEIGARKSQYHGWLIDSIDTDTRYMVASGFKKKRDLEEAKEILQNAKDKTGNQFEVITSDGWLAYPKAIQKVWKYNQKALNYTIKHNVVNASHGGGFNYKIERMHNSIRQRIKICRGFHGSTSSANTLMKGYEIYYNFIRKHLALGKTPSELATDINLSGNRWLGLINISSNISKENKSKD